MVEQSQAAERHCNAVLVALLNDDIIADGAARLNDILDAALEGAVDVVREREEGIRAEADIGILCNPCLTLFLCKDRRLLGEHALPLAVREDIHVILTDVEVDRVVAVGALDVIAERQIQHLRRLSEPPVIRLRAGQSRAVDSGLLACADTDRLTVLDIADGVRLRIFQRDQRDDEIELLVVRDILVIGHDIGEHGLLVDREIVSALLEGHAEHFLVLDLRRLVVRVDLHDIVIALALGLEDFECLRRIARCDNAVRDLACDQRCGD